VHGWNFGGFHAIEGTATDFRTGSPYSLCSIQHF
jgi:hypothetical protein